MSVVEVEKPCPSALALPATWQLLREDFPTPPGQDLIPGWASPSASVTDVMNTCHLFLYLCSLPDQDLSEDRMCLSHSSPYTECWAQALTFAE